MDGSNLVDRMVTRSRARTFPYLRMMREGM